jgi:hypothetical protein
VPVWPSAQLQSQPSAGVTSAGSDNAVSACLSVDYSGIYR